ncbi:MAG: hypothetical protein ACOC22_02935 [bacterium]
MKTRFLKNFILFFWQLIQNIIGLVFLLFMLNDIVGQYDYRDTRVYKLKKFSGVSLGNFIFIGHDKDIITLLHEYGHHKQSVILGPLYIIIVGIPSVLHVLVRRVIRKLFGKNIWTYYSFYTEKWADKLVNIKR